MDILPLLWVYYIKYLHNSGHGPCIIHGSRIVEEGTRRRGLDTETQKDETDPFH